MIRFNFKIIFSNKITVSTIQFLLSLIFGLFSIKFSNYYWLITDSIFFFLGITYFFALLGIIIPGYIYIKLCGDGETFIFSLFSSIAFIFISVFLYIILTYLFSFEILASREVGLIFPLSFGIIGFNIFAFSKKKTILKIQIKSLS